MYDSATFIKCFRFNRSSLVTVVILTTLKAKFLLHFRSLKDSYICFAVLVSKHLSVSSD